MKCEVCKGACCEEVVLELEPRTNVDQEWFGVRFPLAVHKADRIELRFESRCPQLTECGRCAIHFTSKPVACVLYEAGGADCLEVVGLRRTPVEYQAIRDAADPHSL